MTGSPASTPVLDRVTPQRPFAFEPNLVRAGASFVGIAFAVLAARPFLVICPLHHDADFMQVFYEGWRIVQAFIEADAQVPKEVSLPRPVDREVARILAERRDFSVVSVIDAIGIFGQPELLATDDKQVELQTLKGRTAIDTLVAPLSRATE